MRKLRVALVIASRVPVEKYGGTQRDIVWLARELTRQGHDVSLVALSGSFVPGVRMILARSQRDIFNNIPSDVDIVNSHTDPPPEGFRFPTLTSVHGNNVKVALGRSWSFVSRDHARRHGRETFVYNGMPVDEHYFSDQKSKRYLFMARIIRRGKDISRAMKLVRDNNLELDIAGGSRWELLMHQHLRQEGAFLTSLDRRFRFHGMVGGWEKARLFAESRALLFPIRWEEPYGLVVIESLLAGTPVIASPCGSMPELVHPDIGFLCTSDADYAAAFEAVGAIPAHRCRDYAAENFSIEKTTRQYVELYRRILDGEVLP